MDTFYLRQALALAQLRRGFCAPNPAVGAVVVRGGRVLSRGYHRAAGQAHAEVEALQPLSETQTAGATLYVTLEPCCHFGKTPPCTELILRKKIAEVVYAFRDPNPAVSGKGEQSLRSGGVAVRHLAFFEIDYFYSSYLHWTRTRMPFTTAKLAMSLDGKVAGPGGQPLPLTGSEANRLTHECRLRADVVLTTANTVIADNPRLNTRIGEMQMPKPVVVLDPFARTPVGARVFESASSIRVVISAEAPLERRRALVERGAELMEFPTVDGRFELENVLAYLGRNAHDVWVEAGPQLFGALLQKQLAQKALLYLAPVVVGEGGGTAFGSGWENTLGAAKITWNAYGRDVVAEVVW